MMNRVKRETSKGADRYVNFANDYHNWGCPEDVNWYDNGICYMHTQKLGNDWAKTMHRGWRRNTGRRAAMTVWYNLW